MSFFVDFRYFGPQTKGKMLKRSEINAAFGPSEYHQIYRLFYT